MRKTNFLSSLGTKLALAAIVLVSSMFTSCEKEDFSATFEPGDAIVTLNVKVTFSPTLISETGLKAEK